MGDDSVEKEFVVETTQPPSSGSSQTSPESDSAGTPTATMAEAARTSKELEAGGPDVAASKTGLPSAGNGPRPAYFKNTFQEVAFVSQATIATATNSFFAGAVSIVTASIGRDLGMTQGQITWISAASALTAGAFQLGLGQMADLLGRKMIFIVGMGSFSALTLLVAFAQNPFWMDIVCGVLGISSAMVVPPAIGIMGAAYDVPSKRKNLAFSAFSAGNPLGFVFGSIMCGIATKLFNWRAAFIFLAIVWTIFTVLAFWTVPKVEAYDTSQPFRVRLRTFFKVFDLLGTVLTVLGCGLVTASITLGPVDGWKSPHVIAMLVVGVVLLGAFVYWQKIYATPLMPLHIWKDRNFTFIILTCLPGFMGFMSTQFWLSLFMQEVQNLSALEVALHLLPQAIAGLIWNIVAGHSLHRVNNTLLLALGVGSYIVSNVLLSLMTVDSSYWAFVFPALVLGVVGADFNFNVANMYVMQSLPSHQQALAGGIFNTLFRLGSAIALGLSTAVYSSVATTEAAAANPLLPFTRAFQVSVGLSAAGLLFLPFVRLGTQGHAPESNLLRVISRRSGRGAAATETASTTGAAATEKATEK